MVSKDVLLLLTLVVSSFCVTLVSSSTEAELVNLQSLVSDDELDEARLFTSGTLTSTGDGNTQVTFTGWEWAVLFTSIVLLTALFSALLAHEFGGDVGIVDTYGPAPTGYAQPAPIHHAPVHHAPVHHHATDSLIGSSYAIARNLEEAASKFS